MFKLGLYIFVPPSVAKQTTSFGKNFLMSGNDVYALKVGPTSYLAARQATCV